MSNVPADLRQKLSQTYSLRSLKVAREDRSRVDGTVKFTFDSGDDSMFSAVFLPHGRYNSLCISTQVGCAWGCRFCASGLVPFQRNLTSGEILDQIFWVEEKTGRKVQNVLFMGMGEPLANPEGTVKTIQWLTSKNGFGMSPSHITLSTTGVAPQIKKIAELGLKVNLALSLHAPTDELRSKIMPVSSKFAVKDVLEACRDYAFKNDAEFTIEYILLKGVNDGLKTAEQLVKLLSSIRFRHQPKINLIPYNPVQTLPYRAPDHIQSEAFFAYLKAKKFLVHTRKPQGRDISGACGQLL